MSIEEDVKAAQDALAKIEVSSSGVISYDPKDWCISPRIVMSLLAELEARGKDAGWLPMVSAPLDGSEIEILVRHSSWWPAHKEGDGSAWQQACRGHWIDFNGGGWTWTGLAGVPMGWRPIAAIDTALSKGAQEGVSRGD